LPFPITRNSKVSLSIELTWSVTTSPMRRPQAYIMAKQAL